MKYKNPTLIEVYAELFFADGTLPESTFFDVVPHLKAAGFSDVEMSAGVLKINVQEQSAEPRSQIRCWNQDRTRLVQLRGDFVAANLVGTYPGWTAFLEVFQTARAAVAPTGAVPQSLSLITNDRLTVSSEDFTLDRYLHVGGTHIPSWYAGATEPLDITLGWGTLSSDGFNRQLRAKVRPQDDDTTKIEFRAAFHEVLGDADPLDKLENLHDRSLEMFEELITDVTREDVMGGPV